MDWKAKRAKKGEKKKKKKKESNEEAEHGSSGERTSEPEGFQLRESSGKGDPMPRGIVAAVGRRKSEIKREKEKKRGYGEIGGVNVGGTESVGGESEIERENRKRKRQRDTERHTERERERERLAAVREVISSATFRQDEL